MNLLIIYNTCNIGGPGNIPFYVDSIRSLLRQKTNAPLRICLSACMPSQMWIIQSENTFGNQISYNFITDNVPLSVSFNHSVDKMVARYGAFDGYLYVDSGISFWDPSNRYDALQRLIDIHEKHQSAITAAMPSNDDGRQWWGIQYPENQDYVFPVGKTTNMHCQIFDEAWRRAYAKILPDIFASHCMESVFSHMSSAIRKPFVLTQEVCLLHNHSMDGASIGSRAVDTSRIPMSRIFETGGLLFKTKREMNDVYREGKKWGFGIEECKPYWPHDPDCFKYGLAIHEELEGFLKQSMYLTKDEFDYDTITHRFTP
jgi:hypothetical protein